MILKLAFFEMFSICTRFMAAISCFVAESMRLASYWATFSPNYHYQLENLDVINWSSWLPENQLYRVYDCVVSLSRCCLSLVNNWLLPPMLLFTTANWLPVGRIAKSAAANRSWRKIRPWIFTNIIRISDSQSDDVLSRCCCCCFLSACVAELSYDPGLLSAGSDDGIICHWATGVIDR